jgi:hypothetical protein
VFLAAGAVEFLHVLGVGVHDEQMSGHGTFLSGPMLNEGDIGSAAALMRYGILTGRRPNSGRLRQSFAKHGAAAARLASESAAGRTTVHF